MWALSIRPPRSSGVAPVDVVVQATPRGTVADLGAALAEHLGTGIGTYVVPVSDDVPWPACHRLAACGLRNGDVLDVVVVSDAWTHQRGTPVRPRAMVRVVSGPDAGQVYHVSGRSINFGRSEECTVRLTDPMVSRRHARMLLDEPCPVVADEGSASGTMVEGVPASRPMPAEWGTPITVGATTLVVEAAGDGPDEHGVLRPPRFGEPLASGVLEVAAAPTTPQVPSMPWAMLISPLVLSAGMFAFGPNLWYILSYLVGWPLIMLAEHLLQRRRTRRQHAREVAVWRIDLGQALDLLARNAKAQRQQAIDDHPELGTLRRRVADRAPSVWNRQPHTPDFLAVRVGIGATPALLTAVVANGGDRKVTLEGRTKVEAMRMVPDTPIAVELGTCRLVAVVGPAERVDAAARSLLMRLCTDHSPTDLSVTAVLGETRRQEESWLRWLPHASARPGGMPPVAFGPAAGHALLDGLAAEDGGHGATVCLIDATAGVARRRVEAAATADTDRLYFVWLGESVASVPAHTDQVVDLTSSLQPNSPARSAACVGTRDRGGIRVLSGVDALELADAWRLARTMHPYTDESAVRPADTALPESVRLPDVATDLADPDDMAAIRQRWAARRTGLRAQLGAGIDGVVSLDLREDGPHGLIAGTTGSGKSELLQTLLVSLAMNNPPEAISFLLVDYKGGAAFRECRELPHTVGCITDLDGGQVRRVLVSLGAEITAREQLLHDHGAKDLVQLERYNPAVAPPSLLICVDEFAALTAEVPDFVDGIVNVAQRGRSLGLHLLLATQRPTGVITDNIQANTDLRIALRVASSEDSVDVLGRPAAAAISRRTPGRALIRRIGHGTIDLAQIAWVGAREQLAAADPPVRVRPFTAARPSAPVLAEEHRLHGATDLDRLVRTIRDASAGSERPRWQRPWLPPLSARLPLEQITGAAAEFIDDGLVAVGRIDQPAQRRQPALLLNYPKVGHIMAYGASRSGKTQLLRTIATSASLGQASWLYGVDFGGGGLGDIANWPAVGGVIGDDDPGRLLRLLTWLDHTVRDRNRIVAAHHASDLADLPTGTTRPRIHLLIDNLPALLGVLTAPRVPDQHLNRLISILQEGRRVGVHVTATMPSQAAMPTAIQAAFGQRLVLRMVDDHDYTTLGVPAAVLTADSPPGRGLLGTDEIQIAITDRCQQPATPQVSRQTSPPSVPVMPDRVPAISLPAPTGDRIPLALNAADLNPLTVSLRGAVLLVAGRVGSGRSAMLAGIAAQAARSTQPPDHIVVLSTPDQTDTSALHHLRHHEQTAGWSLLLIDDAHAWERHADPATLDNLVTLVEQAPTLGLGVAVAVDTDHAHHDAGDLIRAAKRTRTGVLLQPSGDDDYLFGVTQPSYTIEPLTAPGRGLWCAAGNVRVVHVVSDSAREDR